MKKQMKNLLITFMAMFLVFSVPVMAQAQVSTTTEDLPDPGVTPDSILYFIDLAMDNIALATTFNRDARIQKQLEISKERLAEVKAMALEGKLDAMTKAEDEHGKTMLKLKSEIEDIGKDTNSTDAESTLKKQLEIEREIKHHSEKIKDIKGEIEIDIKVKGEITPEQQALIDSILANLDGQSADVKVKIENEKAKIKIKVEQETGHSGDELEDELKDELGISEEERQDTLKNIAEVRKDLAEIKIEAENEGLKLDENLILQIDTLLEQAQNTFDAGNFDDAKKLVHKTDAILHTLKNQIEDLSEGSEDKESESEVDHNTESENKTSESEEETDHNNKSENKTSESESEVDHKTESENKTSESEEETDYNNKAENKTFESE